MVLLKLVLLVLLFFMDYCREGFCKNGKRLLGQDVALDVGEGVIQAK